MIRSLDAYAVRARRPLLPALVGVLCLVGGPCIAAAPVRAQTPGNEAGVDRAYHIAVRVGAVVSTALVEDAIAPGVGSVTATPELTPTVGVSAWMTLRERLDLELELGWSGPDLRGDDGLSEWTADQLGIVHGAVALRLRATPLLYGRAGVGVIRYSGDRVGGYLEDDPQVHPYATVGFGAQTDVGRVVLFADANAQVHRFTFRALREAGGERGFVWRGLFQVGAALPLGGGA